LLEENGTTRKYHSKLLSPRSSKSPGDQQITKTGYLPDDRWRQHFYPRGKPSPVWVVHEALAAWTGFKEGQKSYEGTTVRKGRDVPPKKNPVLQVGREADDGEQMSLQYRRKKTQPYGQSPQREPGEVGLLSTTA